MLISGVEAKKKFRILEAQLIQILESGQVTVYTKKGYLLTTEQLQKRQDEAYSHQINHFKKQFDKINEEESFKSTLHEMAKRTSLANLALRFYYNENEFKAALARLYPESFPKMAYPLPKNGDESKLTGIISDEPTSNNSDSLSMPDIITAWKQAVVSFENRPDTRDNSALSKRMELYFRRLAGESHKDIAQEHPNLSRDLSTATKKDVPKLLKIFPDLPPLPALRDKMNTN